MADDVSQETLPATETRRQRELLTRYSAAIRNIPVLGTSDPAAADYVARPSSDSILTALCQLTTLRLGVQRAMISLIDDKHQFILAEATSDQSLRLDRIEKAASSLWLGNVRIPRAWGLCERVLNLESQEKVLVINDLAPFRASADRPHVQTAPNMRFYASTALRSPKDVAMGAICIYDDKIWDTFSESHADLLTDFASTIVEYLNTYTVKERFERGERFTRGLVSFSEGASTLMPFQTQERYMAGEFLEATSDLSITDPEPTTEGTTDYEAASTLPSLASPNRAETKRSFIRNRPASINSQINRASSARHRSIRTLQDNILPANSKSMFSRAASVLIGSSDLDGVLILDASVAANGQRRASPGPDSGTEPLTESYNSRSSSSDNDSPDIEGIPRGISSSSSKMCQILGVVTRDGASDFSPLLEPDLARLLRDYPHGKVFNFTADGVSLASTEESAQSSGSTDVQGGKVSIITPSSPKQKISNRALRSSNALQATFTGARSIAFIPFWDYERSRWFAGCLCWTDDPYRLLSTSADLPYFKIFSHSIMRELSRLDALAVKEVRKKPFLPTSPAKKAWLNMNPWAIARLSFQNPVTCSKLKKGAERAVLLNNIQHRLTFINHQSKTSFVASISHELRSPLHGILGTLEFIKDTDLDSFQVSMLNSLNACGRTLLDTVNHVMDHAKVNETRRNISSRRLKNANTIRLLAKPRKDKRKTVGAFDVGIATEEVMEAVFSGSTYMPVLATIAEDLKTPLDQASNPFMERKEYYIVLDLAFEQDWIYSFPIGSWRRIVMNIFGNAIKYTKSGFVHVALRANDSKTKGSMSTITMTVTDSGCGMSPSFLANRAFQPFSQENPHAIGTGLGLSIIRQIIETNGGKVDISSDTSGTKVVVKMALAKPDGHVEDLTESLLQFKSVLPRLAGRRICFLHRRIAPPSENPNLTRTDEGLVRFTNALVNILENHLKMTVMQSTNWEGHDADLVIVPELSFDYLQAIRKNRINNNRAPVTIFIAMDAIEAAALRSDARVMSRQSVVEIMTQPCGPHKLANILNRCLDRFALPEENLRRPMSINSSPLTLPSTPKALPQMTAPFNTLQAQETPAAEITTISSLIALPTPPVPPAATPVVSEPSVTSPEVETSNMLHILVTDDNLINRRILAAFLKKQKVSHSEAADGLQALTAYKKGTPRFDVILMDMSMPVMDGMASTRAIREFENSQGVSRCCIVALTGLTSPSAKLEAWNSGIDHFMTKPINFKALEILLKKEEEKKEGHQRQASREETQGEAALSADTKEQAESSVGIKAQAALSADIKEEATS